MLTEAVFQAEGSISRVRLLLSSRSCSANPKQHRQFPPFIECFSNPFADYRCDIYPP
jgi:hypothetical protein